MSSPSTPAPKSRRLWLALPAVLALVACGLYFGDRGAGESSDDAGAAAAQVERAPEKQLPRVHPADPGEALGDGPLEVAVQVTYREKPVANARVQLVPLDPAHGAIAPACPCAESPDAGDALSIDDDPLSSLEAECGACSEGVDGLFEAAARGAGFLAGQELRTGADGVVRFPVQAGENPALWIQAEGLRPATLLANVEPAGADPARVELEGPSTASVHIEDADGNPVRDAELAAFSALPFWPLTPVLRGPEQALANLPTGGDVMLLARAPGFVSTIQPLSTDAVETVLVLVHPRAVRGRVLHGEVPVAGATVRLTGESREGSLATTSDKEGRFLFASVAPGAYQLSGDKGKLHGEQEVQLSDGDPDGELALSLAESATLRGTVSDAQSGKPIAGAEVELRSNDDGISSVVTDDRGQYELSFTPGSYLLQASEEAHLTARRTLTFREGESRTLDVALEGGLTVVGRVVDGRDQPVADAHVGLEAADFGEGEQVHRDATTDADGRFTLSGLREGAHVLSVDAEGHPSIEQALSVPSAALTLRLADGAILEGVVLGPQGPVKGARVELAGERPGMLGSAVADEAGHFELSGLPAGRATAVAIASGFAASEPSPLALRDGARAHLDLRLSEGLALRGKVVDDRGRPVPDAMVEAYLETGARAPLPGRNVSATSGPDGTFALTGLREGSYRMFAYHDGLAQGPAQTVSAGTSEVELKLLRTGRITGRVLSRSGAPLRRFMVEGQEFHSTDGAFVLRDVSPDAAEIIVEGPFPSVLVPVSAKPGEVVDVGTVLVDDGEPLAGRVLTGDGQPAPGVEVTALPPGYEAGGPAMTDDDGSPRPDAFLDSPRSVMTDPDGRFAFDHLRRGSYLVQAKAQSGTSAPQRVSTGSAQVELVLQAGGALHGRASLTDGSPVRDGAAIFVAGAVTAQARVVGGVFELRGLPSGPGQLLVTSSLASSHATAVQELSLNPGESREIAVTLASLSQR